MMNINEKIKQILQKILPAYRVSLRVEEQLYRMDYQLKLMNKRQEMCFWWLLQKPEETLNETQKRFFLGLPKADGRLREIQLLLLGLLKRFNDICRKNNINYWLEGGNLLGAIRHKGFVPWDDDLDVGISRKDFNKLFLLIEYENDLEVVYQYDDKNNYCFPKLVLKNSQIALWLDFIIYDEINCNNWDKVKVIWNRRTVLKNECKKELRDKLKTKNKTDNIFRSKNDIEILRNVYERYSNKLCGEGVSNYFMVSAEFPDDMCTGIRCFPKKWIYPLKTVKFDDLSLYIPQEADKYLTSLYGDIYSLPLDAGFQRHIQLEDVQNLLKENQY